MNVLHLDFKGLQPEFKHLIELLVIFKDVGYEALLVEWEDCFPWTVNEEFRSPTAYTNQQVCTLMAEADKIGLEIIPLVQTLGHMETFLGPNEYKSLRERENYSDVLNPLADGAAEFVSSLVDDVLRLSPGIRYFHIGGDEASSLGTHYQTKEYCKDNGVGNLFLSHYEPIMDKLNSNGIRPMIWHDMLIGWSDDELLCLKDKADIVFWGYGEPADETDSHYKIEHIKRFADLGMQLWGATADKGADGNTKDLPVIEKRVRNAMSWYGVKKQFGLKGIFATAWSRYSTHRPQCEPIDAAIDSMCIVSDIIKNGTSEKEARAKFLHYMNQGNMEQFDICKNAITRFTEIRELCWAYARYLIEQCTLEDMIPEKNSSRISELDFASLKKCYQEFVNEGERLKSIFYGLVIKDCLDEYIDLRVRAIEEIMNFAVYKKGNANEACNDVIYNGKAGVYC